MRILVVEKYKERDIEGIIFQKNIFDSSVLGDV